MRENRLAAEVRIPFILKIWKISDLQVSSLLRACLRADEQITQRNKLELDISTNEEDIGTDIGKNTRKDWMKMFLKK